MSKKLRNIVAASIELILTNPDAGEVYEITCPECDSKVRWAKYAYWSKRCDCGYEWSITIEAFGSKWVDV